ncbi:MAG: energy-coupling factor transporter ATPase [Blautia sp.]|nr:energy-coupling factor transporter ATPase [Blautia sp.]
MGIIKALKLGFEYLKYDDDGNPASSHRAVDDVNIDIEPGEFIAVLGHNGSGKSTLAKHMNALLLPTEGTIWIDGTDTKTEPELWKLRQKAGMVFQNPDNQIIASVVEEDVGFGPENLGLPTEKIWKRVDESLKKTGMTAYRSHSPNRLSGGQKQRVAIAGVMAMRPRCIVLDEPTAMLDPVGRREVLDAVLELNRQEGVTVILITHYMEEVVRADRVFVMDNGSVALTGTPREVFAQVDRLKELRLDVPQVTLLGHELFKAGLDVPEGILFMDELADAVSSLAGSKETARDNNVRNGDTDTGTIPGTYSDTDTGMIPGAYSETDLKADTVSMASGSEVSQQKNGILKLSGVNYVYSPGTSFEVKALEDINLDIPEGQFIGIIGHTGSGKSTLIQHLNALIRPTSGRITYKGEDVWDDKYDRKALRSEIGLVFQYPEHQLFENDVLSDVCFGPMNQGLTREEAEKEAKKALLQVGFKEKRFLDSPFELSGGQKKRVAIAGVLAMNPKILILDEPTAGLDPHGRDEILERISLLHKERGITVILVSHSMEDIAKYAERLIVMNEGKVVYDDTPPRVFRHYEELEKMGLSAPQITYIMNTLRKKGMDVDVTAGTVEEAKKEILSALERTRIHIAKGTGGDTE